MYYLFFNLKDKLKQNLFKKASMELGRFKPNKNRCTMTSDLTYTENKNFSKIYHSGLVFEPSQTDC